MFEFMVSFLHPFSMRYRAVYCLQQIAVVKGLGDISINTSLICQAAVLILGTRSDHDDGQTLHILAGAYVIGQFDAIHVGHLQVGQ
jgi:hypothetical protein